MTNVVDAHFPPDQPPTNEWDPGSEQYSTVGIAEPSHGDDPTAQPMSDAPGQDPGTVGSTPDGRMNLLDAVKGAAPQLPPVQEVHHTVETFSVGSDRVRGRVVRVVNNNIETTLLEQNPNRVRAIIKPITTNGVIIIGSALQGGNPQYTAIPTGPAAFYPQATGDPTLTIESTAAVVAYGTVAAGFCDVAIWEELQADAPGL